MSKARFHFLRPFSRSRVIIKAVVYHKTTTTTEAASPFLFVAADYQVSYCNDMSQSQTKK